MYGHEKVAKNKEIMTNWVKSLSQEDYNFVKSMDPDDLVDLWSEHFGVERWWVS
tara:strand:- start:89 stop:250 length:162 start_codon:yes stop_codon:yes gene_type:complete